jgi:hypothetical protein
MAASSVYRAFKRVSCVELNFSVWLPASKSLLSRIKTCLGGRRRSFPYNFACIYPGEGKEKLCVSVWLVRVPHKDILLHARWFEAKEGRPAESGRFGDLLGCIREYVPEREGRVTALFSYDSERVTSFFKPIRLADQPVIFDEITGITGVKRNPEGKMVYELEISFEGDRVNHAVTFAQTLELSEDTLLPLLEVASRISMLALRPKEVK